MDVSEIYAIEPDINGWRQLPGGYRVTLGNGVKLGNGVTLGDWVTLGNGVTLGNEVRLGDWVKLGNEVTLGNEVKLGNGVKLGNEVTLGDGVRLGDWVTLGNGVTLLYSPLVIYGPYVANDYGDGRIRIGNGVHTPEEWRSNFDTINKSHRVPDDVKQWALHVIDLIETDQKFRAERSE